MIRARPEPLTSDAWRPLWGGRSVAIAVAICAASELAAGAFFGFRSIAGHLTFWLLAALLAVPAGLLTLRLWPSSSFSDLAMRAGVLSFAVVVSCGLLLGAARLVAPLPYLLAEIPFLLLAVIVLARLPAAPRHASQPAPLPGWLFGLCAVLLALVIATGLGHSPFTLYDSLSYHLFFPARWLQAHRLSIIPTPFSDEAQAYQPANGELWFLWLMLPFHGDFLARLGQFPFYLLGATALFLLARSLGATPAHALYAPAFFLIAPSVVEQAIGANVDLIHATLFVTSLILGLAASHTNARRDWALWGISLGLFVGTKYLALVYLPILLAIPLVRRPRAQVLRAIPGLAALGAPWYVRNWLVAGSPIYPATLSLAGVTLGQGAYTRQAMTRSFLHVTDARLLAASLAHAYGTTICLVLLPAVVLVLFRVLARRAWWPAGFVMLATAAMLPLCWLNVADNADSRFLLPVVVTSFGLLPLAFGTNRYANGTIHAFYALGIAWVLIGSTTDLQPSFLPWFMKDWLSLHGIIDRQFLWPFVALVLVGSAAAFLAARRPWIMPAAVSATAVIAVALAIGAETWCVPSRCDFLVVASPHLRLTFLYGSRWLDANAGVANVAYSGINLPYLLSGSHFTRVVSYVNIDRHADWRFDQYARAYQRAPSHRSGPLLAQPSGLLEAAVARDGAIDALRPRFERMVGTRETWEANLDARGVQYVFISTLDPYEVDYVWHNAEGFPIEDDWARADARFRLAYENPDVRIYEVHPS